MSTGYPDFWRRAWMVITMFFITLKDTPHSYIGQANKVPAVKAGEDGLEFVAHPTTLAALTEKEHDSLTGVTSDQHHAQIHAHASHTGIGADDHHAQAHTLASHSTKAHAELSDVTKDQHHNEDHHARHEDGGADIIVPPIHHTRHETGGADEVAGLVFPFVWLDPPVYVMDTSIAPFDWTDIDITALTTPNVAKAVILCIETYFYLTYTSNYGKRASWEARFRKKGSLSESSSAKIGSSTGIITADYAEADRLSGMILCEVNGDEIFQVKLSDVGTKVWTVLNFWVSLVGYIK